MKIFNVGERLVINNIRGYLQTRIVFYLMNVHHKKRTIWFARVRLPFFFLSLSLSLIMNDVDYSQDIRQ